VQFFKRKFVGVTEGGRKYFRPEKNKMLKKIEKQTKPGINKCNYQ